MNPVTNRYDFVFLFDVTDGNPNGDPDAGNLPRIDPEDGRGLVTDVCLKRKVRNYVLVARDDKPRHRIFIKEKAILNDKIEEAHESVDKDDEKLKGQEKVEKARQWMCREYYDVRTFGAVMSTGKNAGQVLGPVQLTFGRSIDRIVPAEHAITRMAVATEKEAEKQHGDNRTMGRKATIPYGLYRTHGFVNVPPAEKTGFDEEDLALFWEALKGMFDLDRSAARGMMSARGLIVFKHESPLGNAPAAQLFERVRIRRTSDRSLPPRTFGDYEVVVDELNLPAGVVVQRML